MNIRKFKLSFRSRSRFLILAIVMLIFAIATSPVVATVAEQANVVQTQQSGLQLAAKAKSLYQAGRFTEAVEVWQQAASAFANVGDRANQGMALSNLSLTYQQLGQWQAAQTAVTQSLNLLKTASDKTQKRILAQALSIQGQLQLATGQSKPALETWQQADAVYAQISDQTGEIQSQIYQAQAFQALGLYRRALAILTELKQTLDKQLDSPLKVMGLLSLGNAHSVAGDLTEAEKALKQSLEIANKLQPAPDRSTILLSLGNVTRAKNQYSEAISYYKQASHSPSSKVRIKAELNQLNLLVETQQWQTAKSLWAPILTQLNNLPPSRSTVYAQINLAQSLFCLKQPNLEKSAFHSPIVQQCVNTTDEKTQMKNLTQSHVASVTPEWTDIEKLLIAANDSAVAIQDKRAEAYALGYRAGLYQQTQRLSEAETLTQQALNLARTINATDITYRWQWQLGRIARVRADLPKAISAYTQAFKNLQSLRGDLVVTNSDIQFSFRDSVEPVYRELVDLLLEQKQPSQNDLKLAREVIESLQLAELDDFFREACVDAKPQQIDQIVEQAQPRTGVIYAFFLEKSLEVILKLPGQDLLHYKTAVSRDVATNTLQKLQEVLPLVDKTREVRQLSQEIYKWLIEPERKTLDSSGVETLVFVLDSGLRNIPMAMLYDGKEYLVQKYAIALTPGLQLLSPRLREQIELKVLQAAVSQHRQIEGRDFSQLTNVESELKQIQSQVAGSKQLLNQQFTKPNFQRQINANSFSVVHLATHGQFSSDPEQTFLMLWDQLLKAKELNNLLRSTGGNRSKTIELLVLSACQTATGDDRAALGLAGVAIRAGARSTIATLWSVNDVSTSTFMKQFYQELANSKITKAQALQHAQVALLSQQGLEPYYWAPYTLIGNWL
ncbi:CHAT domain-containing protein [Scytonema sp. UIC 10036]|uniref:CHAT domain-containing protein n=1 Tax=Scytonema sp. UIC 10036 TaxID=2304196 RepID=UPI0012DA6A6E|nr:CHAT domain-containing protein [Scytonema sp. UIC 10036]MUG98114.1 CHAT domain-containing protein [Scytonema sp. UIC 10036]